MPLYPAPVMGLGSVLQMYLLRTLSNTHSFWAETQLYAAFIIALAFILIRN